MQNTRSLVVWFSHRPTYPTQHNRNTTPSFHAWQAWPKSSINHARFLVPPELVRLLLLRNVPDRIRSVCLFVCVCAICFQTKLSKPWKRGRKTAFFSFCLVPPPSLRRWEIDTRRPRFCFIIFPSLCRFSFTHLNWRWEGEGFMLHMLPSEGALLVILQQVTLITHGGQSHRHAGMPFYEVNVFGHLLVDFMADSCKSAPK